MLPALEQSGRVDWIRTSDPLTPSQVRYQTAPPPEIIAPSREKIIYRHSLKNASENFGKKNQDFEMPPFSLSNPLYSI